MIRDSTLIYLTSKMNFGQIFLFTRLSFYRDLTYYDQKPSAQSKDKTIKTITGSSMDFFVIYKCLQLARKKSSPLPPHPSLSLPSVCAQQFQTVLIFFPYVCLTRFSIVLIDTNHLCPKCGFSLVLTLQLAPNSLRTK